MIVTLPSLSIFEAITTHSPEKTAIIHGASGRNFTYGSLVRDVAAARDNLTKTASGKVLDGERIAFLAENGYDYVVTFLSILASNAIAVPLSQGFPTPEIRYILQNSDTSLLLSTTKFESKARDVVSSDVPENTTLSVLDKIENGAEMVEKVQLEPVSEKDVKSGFMLYTSGTTSRPKGVVLSTSTITAQAKSLIEAWKYSSSDHLLHVLPLHHIHGTINALYTPLIAGSTVEFAFPFNADATWNRLAAPFLENGNTASTDKEKAKPITFFTVVPTVYNRLLSSINTLAPEIQAAAKTAISPKNMRVNISGSAALPTPTKQAWTDLSGGNVLLERYGMTEVGMALSCGLSYNDRVDGSVGWPLPSVEARLVDVETGQVIEVGSDIDSNGKQREGEIQLRGPTVFNEYWRNAEATAKEFVEATDGKEKWFKTGDVAVRQLVEGAGESDQPWARGPMYFIRGRNSVDIIKTGGEKVSALEIERELLSLPEVSEAAVVGVESEQWGQKVAAVIVLTEKGRTAGKSGKAWGAMDMRRALKDRLANYKIPQEVRIVQAIPRNAMGKINKKALVKEVFG